TLEIVLLLDLAVAHRFRIARLQVLDAGLTGPLAVVLQELRGVALVAGAAHVTGRDVQIDSFFGMLGIREAILAVVDDRPFDLVLRADGWARGIAVHLSRCIEGERHRHCDGRWLMKTAGVGASRALSTRRRRRRWRRLP